MKRNAVQAGVTRRRTPDAPALELAAARPAQLAVGEAVALFLAHKRRQGLQTRQTDMALRGFRRWVGDDSLAAAITLRDVEFGFFPAFEDDFQARRHRLPSISFIRSIRLALRGLYKFLDDYDFLIDRHGALIKNPLRNLEVPSVATPKCEHLTHQAAATLIEAAKTPRQKIVTNLLRWAGVRSCEAVSLADEDVDLEQGEIYVRTSKTARGRRTIPILPQLEEPIREWRAYRAQHNLNQPGSPFLVTRAGTRMQPRYVWRIVRDVAARAGMTTTSGRRITPHTLRRTFATDLLNRGVRLETVSRLLGHAATTVTEQSYAQLTDHRIRTEVEEAFRTNEVKAATPKRPRVFVASTVFSQSTPDSTLTLRDGSRTTIRVAQRAHNGPSQPHAHLRAGPPSGYPMP
jgi:site-specific recombinase XerD